MFFVLFYHLTIQQIRMCSFICKFLESLQKLVGLIFGKIFIKYTFFFLSLISNLTRDFAQNRTLEHKYTIIQYRSIHSIYTGVKQPFYWNCYIQKRINFWKQKYKHWNIKNTETITELIQFKYICNGWIYYVLKCISFSVGHDYKSTIQI